MNFISVLLIILVIIVVAILLYKFLAPKTIVINNGGDSSLFPLNAPIKVRALTFNLGSNKRTKNEWYDIIKNWNIVQNKDFDILYVSLQEMYNNGTKYGMMGDALAQLLPEYNYNTYSQNGPPGIMNHPFSVQAHVYTRKYLGSPKILTGKKCHVSKYGMCTKSTVGIALDFKDHRLICMASHLPIKTKKDDLGYYERLQAVKESISLLKDLKAHDKQNSVIWSGDMNFRKDTMVEGEIRDDQLTYLMTSTDLLKEFSEADITFSPTCKLHEDMICRNEQNTPESCYNTDTSKGKRSPSYCDRILTNNLQVQKYYSYTDGVAVNHSDHNMVVLDGTINNHK